MMSSNWRALEEGFIIDHDITAIGVYTLVNVGYGRS